DIHVAFDLAATGLVDELFGRFSHDRVAVVVEPVDQRSNREKLLILDDGGVIERPQQIAARLKLAQKPLVIDVEAERPRGGIEIGTVNEQRKFFFVWGHEFSLSLGKIAELERPRPHPKKVRYSIELIVRDPFERPLPRSDACWAKGETREE